MADPAPEIALEAEDLVKAVFQKWDVDSDGGLSPDEFFTLPHDCDEAYWTKDRAQALYATIDINKDGSINTHEFVQWVLSPGSVDAERNLVRQLEVAVGSKSEDAKTLQFLEFSTLGGSVFAKAVDPRKNVAQLKVLIFDDCDIPPEQQELVYRDTKLAGDLPIGDIAGETPGLPEKVLRITIIRKSKRDAFLCVEALKQFKAKNLSESVVHVSVSENREQAIDPGATWDYAKVDFWDGRYFDLDFTNGGGVSENGSRQSFFIRARTETENEEWHLTFKVKSYDCSALIDKMPPEFG